MPYFILSNFTINKYPVEWLSAESGRQLAQNVTKTDCRLQRQGTKSVNRRSYLGDRRVHYTLCMVECLINISCQLIGCLNVKIFLMKLNRPNVFQVDHAKYLHASVPKLYINSLEEGVGKASRCINIIARGSIAAVAR